MCSHRSNCPKNTEKPKNLLKKVQNECALEASELCHKFTSSLANFTILQALIESLQVKLLLYCYYLKNLL